MLHFSSGPFAPTAFNDFFSHFPIHDYRVCQAERDQVAITVDPDWPPAERFEYLAKIAAYARTRLPMGVTAYVEVAELAPGSQRYQTIA